jgi:hypothetical protein
MKKSLIALYVICLAASACGVEHELSKKDSANKTTQKSSLNMMRSERDPY